MVALGHVLLLVGGIVDTLEDMQEKAEASLSSTRKDEMEAAHSSADQEVGFPRSGSLSLRHLQDRL